MYEVSLSVPFEVDDYGKVAVSTTQEKIWSDRVVSVIGTSLNERIMRSRFGTAISGALFGTSTEAQIEIETETTLAFANQLPLLTLLSANADTDPFTGEVTLSIVYSLPNNEQTSVTLGFVYIDGNNPPYQETT
jgi:phage baseplate assembly protein W